MIDITEIQTFSSGGALTSQNSKLVDDNKLLRTLVVGLSILNVLAIGDIIYQKIKINAQHKRQ